jgi:hypothetical protein
MIGIVKTYGKKAIAIQTDNLRQYYGPLEDVNHEVIPLLTMECLTIAVLVKFKVDYTKYSGEIRGVKRYYAYDITLNDTIVI